MERLLFIRLILALACFLVSTQINGETSSLIENEIDEALRRSVWQVGPVGFTPQVEALAGYDSNSLSESVEPIADVSFRVSPSISAKAPVKRRALLTLDEDLHFIYYRDVDRLDDVFNITRLGGATGGQNWIVHLEDVFRRGKLRSTTEFDTPTKQRTNQLNASLALLMGKQQLHLAYNNSRLIIDDPEATINGVPVQDRLNNTSDTYTFGIARSLTTRTSAVVDVFLKDREFREILRKDRAFGASAGLRFAALRTIRGGAMLGFEDYDAEERGVLVEFRSLIASVDVEMRLTERLDMRVLYSREVELSFLEDNLFFVQNRYGGTLTFFILPSVSIRAGAILGRNSYPVSTTFINKEGQEVQEMLVDRFSLYSLFFNYRLASHWSVNFGGNYIDRNSDLPFFDKERFFLSAGISSRF